MKLSLEKTRAFWLYIVGGIIALALGVMLLPVWSSFEKLFFSGWGEFAINIMMSTALIAYILLYLVKRIRRYSGTPAQIVAIVELVLMVVIAVVCTVSTFTDVVSFGEPCQIFGLALWARGASGVFTGYYCDSTLVSEKAKKAKIDKKNKAQEKPDTQTEIDTDEEPRGRVDDFTVWRLALAVILISVGTYMFITPPIKQIVFQWVFSCAVIFIGLFVAIYGGSLKPVKVKVKEKKDEKEASVEKANEKTEDKAVEKSTATEKQAESVSVKNSDEKPMLEEGKVTVKLGTSEEKKDSEKKDGEKDNEEKKGEEKKDSDESESNKEQKPDSASTALVVVDTKKDKKKKK